MSPLFIILSAISVALQPSFCVKPENSTPDGAACGTASCRHVGTHILDSMDTTVEPCDNFYNFACGRWASSFSKPNFIRGDWNNLIKLSLLAQMRLADELLSAPTSSDIEPVNLMKQFYESCISQRASDIDAVDKILRILHETGGWPMVMHLDEWDENFMSWQTLEEYYSNIRGHSVFYKIRPTPDDMSLFYTLTIEKSKLWPHMTRDLETYGKLLQTVARASIFNTNVDVSSDQLAKDFHNVLTFESLLYQAYMDTEKNKEPAEIVMYPDKFIQDFKSKTDSYQQSRIDFERVFQRIYAITNVKPSSKNPIIIKHVKYFVELARILHKTPKRIIVNYIHWKFLADILPHATKEMEDLFYQILYNVQNVDRKNPRWIHCVNQIGRNYASYSLFIKKYYQQNSRQRANNVYREISYAWMKQVDNSNWLSPETKSRIKAINGRLSSTLGYSTFYDDDQNIITYFEGLVMGDSYFTNNLNYEYHMWKKQIQLWGELLSSQKILTDPLTLEAYLDRSRNHIVVGPPFLQSPLLDESLPDYVTYSTVGHLMGHETSHVLDSHVVEPLLTETETESYKKILKCFIDSYNLHFNRISSDNACHRGPSRGEVTHSENMADWNGLQFTYQAYQKKKKNRLLSKGPKLPGFGKYTSNQMFFISFAQAWCTANDEDDPSDVHAAPHIRVNGVVANTVEFATAFKCKEHTPMNPTSKCNIWTESKVK